MRLTLALLGTIACATGASAQSQVMRHGEELAIRLCAECHAVGDLGASPHAAAPRFRTLGSRLDLDDFMERLRLGLTSGHVDMPTFRFSHEDARALVGYLRTIQGP